MDNIKSVNAPAIGQKGVDRLFALSRETRLTSASSLFDAGYEQAKRDFRDALQREVGVPAATIKDAPTPVPPAEERARKASYGIHNWWSKYA